MYAGWLLRCPSRHTWHMWRACRLRYLAARLAGEYGDDSGCDAYGHATMTLPSYHVTETVRCLVTGLDPEHVEELQA